MKIHRFFTGNNIELKHNFWLHDERLLHQWVNVLRFRTGQQVALFDGVATERLYEIKELNQKEAHLLLITEMVRQIPKKDMYLLWSLLKKDKNDWVLQKCTELGVSHFVPLLAERSEKASFDEERATKIVIEASEQCGRSDIPNVREPMHIETAVKEFEGKVPLLVCEQGKEGTKTKLESAALLIGPEGGWSDSEKELFKKHKIDTLNLHDFTLRAETAAVSSVTMMMNGGV